MSDGKIEVYRQRYETWRHLDKLRWQMIQFLIAIGSGTAIVIRVSPNLVGGWFWILVGTAVLALAFSMKRISEAIRGNGKVLKSAGAAVGDNDIPDVSDINKSVGHWMTLAVGATGIALVTKGIFFS